MTAHVKISDENAESVGRPIFDKVLQSFSNADRDELIRHFPELQKGMTIQLFDEAVGNLEPLGNSLSIEYSAHTTENDSHILIWNVQYENDDKQVLWKLHLNDSREVVVVEGFGFDR